MAKIPALFESTNFVVAILLFAGLGSATINVSPANVEIEGFILKESSRILQIPDSATLSINFQDAKNSHGRFIFLFFLGKREISIKADYTLAIPGKEMLKGSIKADTSWLTGYCGIIECQSKLMPAEQRIEATKALVSKLFADLNGKFYGIFAVRKAVSSASADTSAPAYISAPTDTSAAPAEAFAPAAPVVDSLSQ
jgi:hypothetical protein